VKGFWHSFGTVGAQMESSEVGTFGEVLCFQRSSGATRRDRTGDLLITNHRIKFRLLWSRRRRVGKVLHVVAVTSFYGSYIDLLGFTSNFRATNTCNTNQKVMSDIRNARRYGIYRIDHGPRETHTRRITHIGFTISQSGSFLQNPTQFGRCNTLLSLLPAQNDLCRRGKFRRTPAVEHLDPQTLGPHQTRCTCGSDLRAASSVVPDPQNGSSRDSCRRGQSQRYRLIKNALLEFSPGARITVAKDTATAVTLLFDPGFRPQLVIADMHMAIGGVEELLKRAETRLIPVVVFSTLLSPGEVAEVLALGAREYVRKPIVWDEIRDAVVGIVTKWAIPPA
jgi:CheY-like chemotaxis protein